MRVIARGAVQFRNAITRPSADYSIKRTKSRHWKRPLRPNRPLVDDIVRIGVWLERVQRASRRRFCCRQPNFLRGD
jgi:hypothetical protein